MRNFLSPFRFPRCLGEGRCRVGDKGHHEAASAYPLNTQSSVTSLHTGE